MNVHLPYCFLHGDDHCQRHTTITQLLLPTTDQSVPAVAASSEQWSTSSQPQSSPQAVSSSGTNFSTAAANCSESGSPAPGSAFSPLALCFKHADDADKDYIAEDGVQQPSLSLSIRSCAQNRFQLLHRFYDLHLGASSHARTIFQYETLGAGQIGSATTTSAMDTLCIAQLATSFNDVQLMFESRRLYSNTMRMLGRNIEAIGGSRPTSDQLDNVIGAIHALTACSWFRCVGTDTLDWTRHAQALLRVLKVFGWDDMSASTRQALRYNWKYRAFWDGISRRVTVEYKDPATTTGTRDLSSALLELGFSTCALLERSDTFLLDVHRKRHNELSVAAFLTELGDLVARFKKWHLIWATTSSPHPRHKLVSTKSFHSFRAISGEHFGVFATASEFSHTAHERDFRILNICLLNLDEAILDIHAAFPKPCTGPEMQAQSRAAEYDAATCAAELCMLVPWSSQPSNMAFACIHAMQPLQYASRYYRKHDQLLQLEWCRKVTRRLSEKYGISVKLWEDSDAFAHC